MAQTQKGASSRTTKSNFFRVIQGASIQVAASSDDFVIQVFSEYPEFSEEQFSTTPSDDSPVTLVRELEVSLTLPLKFAEELGKRLIALGQQAAKEGRAS